MIRTHCVIEQIMTRRGYFLGQWYFYWLSSAKRSSPNTHIADSPYDKSCFNQFWLIFRYILLINHRPGEKSVLFCCTCCANMSRASNTILDEDVWAPFCPWRVKYTRYWYEKICRYARLTMIMRMIVYITPPPFGVCCSWTSGTNGSLSCYNCSEVMAA